MCVYIYIYIYIHLDRREKPQWPETTLKKGVPCALFVDERDSDYVVHNR